MKKKTVLVLIIIISFVSLMYGCSSNKKEFGDFYYSIKTDEETGEQYIRLQGLTEQGQKQTYVVVPSEIDGIKVRELNYSAPFVSEGSLVSDMLRKIYLPYGIDVYSDFAFVRCNSLKDLILFDIPDGTEDVRYYYGTQNTYISSSLYDEIKFGSSNLFEIYPYGGRNYEVKFANVSFMYNFEGALYSGYYWIDNCDYGTKIEYIPENPEQEGYTFGGWYKEPECINEWDFEGDTLPESKLDEEGREVYQETRLYAKWYKL